MSEDQKPAEKPAEQPAGDTPPTGLSVGDLQNIAMIFDVGRYRV